MGDFQNNIDKNHSIIILLNELGDIIKSNSITIVDYWDSDLSAIGFSKINKLCYVNESIKKNTKFEKSHKNIPYIYSYDYDLEIYKSESDLKSGIDRKIIKTELDVDLYELINEFSKFFDE